MSRKGHRRALFLCSGERGTGNWGNSELRTGNWGEMGTSEARKWELGTRNWELGKEWDVPRSGSWLLKFAGG